MHKTSYFRLSEAKPDILKKYLLCEVAEKAMHILYNNFLEMDSMYPDFYKWYFYTVVPEIESNTGKREIIVAMTAQQDTSKYIISGLVIVKKTSKEKKICTLKVHKEYRNMGIGSELFIQSFQYLGTDKPFLTISEDNLALFQPHIEKFGFVKKQELPDYYIKGKTEYAYNEVMV